jgi:broad specificity phosphatase PhoE
MTECNGHAGVSTQVVFARHGETALNAAGCFRGREDPPLTDRGERQARALGRGLAERFPTQRPAILFASPRRRAVATAQIAGAALDLQPTILPDLDDFDYGAWAGRDELGVAHAWPDLYAQWRSDPGAVEFPGGESVRHAEERIVAFLRAVVVQHSGGSVIAVTHDAVIRCVVCRTLMAPLASYHRVTVDLASTTGILANPEPRMLWVNDGSHLGRV